MIVTVIIWIGLAIALVVVSYREGKKDGDSDGYKRGSDDGYANGRIALVREQTLARDQAAKKAAAEAPLPAEPKPPKHDRGNRGNRQR